MYKQCKKLGVVISGNILLTFPNT